MLGTMPTGAAVRLMEHDGRARHRRGHRDCLVGIGAVRRAVLGRAHRRAARRLVAATQRVKTVFVFGDNDESNTGQAAAYTSRARLKAKGLTVVGRDSADHRMGLERCPPALAERQGQAVMPMLAFILAVGVITAVVLFA